MNVVIISKISIVRKKLHADRIVGFLVSEKAAKYEHERRVAEGRRDCYWFYVVTSCKSQAYDL